MKTKTRRRARAALHLPYAVVPTSRRYRPLDPVRVFCFTRLGKAKLAADTMNAASPGGWRVVRWDSAERVTIGHDLDRLLTV